MHATCCPAGLQTARTALTPGLTATRSRQPSTRPRQATTVAQARTDVSRRDVLGFTAAGTALSLTGGESSEFWIRLPMFHHLKCSPSIVMQHT